MVTSGRFHRPTVTHQPYAYVLQSRLILGIRQVGHVDRHITAIATFSEMWLTTFRDERLRRTGFRKTTKVARLEQGTGPPICTIGSAARQKTCCTRYCDRSDTLGHP
jgi:hypothetical protein